MRPAYDPLIAVVKLDPALSGAPGSNVNRANGRYALNTRKASKSHVEPLFDLDSLERALENGLNAIRTSRCETPWAIATTTVGALRWLRTTRHIRARFERIAFRSDDAWALLLELAHCRLEGRPICVSEVSSITAQPPTTALRLVSGLVHSGWIERQPEPTDARRVLLLPNEKANELVVDYLNAVVRAGLRDSDQN